MPVYKYTALSGRGALVNGAVAASSTQELEAMLSQQGLLLQSLSVDGPSPWNLFKSKSLNSEDLLLFTQEFATLLKAGLTVTDALKLVADRPKQKRLEAVLEGVYQGVLQGDALSVACSDYPEAFDPLFLSGLRTGEKTGDLVYSLRRYQVHLRRRIDLSRKVSQALIYPAILFSLLIVVLVVLFTFVIPRFIDMYLDIGAQIPAATQMLINISDGFPQFLLVSLVLTFTTWLVTRHKQVRQLIADFSHRIRSRFTWLDDSLSTLAMARFSRSLATLLGSGGTVHDALLTSGEAVANTSYAQKISKAVEAINAGSSLAQALKQQRLLTPAGIKLVEVGEASGALPSIAEDMAGYYEEQLDNWLNSVMQLIEPLLMLVMGLIVGTVIIVMYLPIFSMTTVI